MSRKFLMPLLIFFIVFTTGSCKRSTTDYGLVKIYIESTPFLLENVQHLTITITEAYAHQIMKEYEPLLSPGITTEQNIQVGLVKTVQNPLLIIKKHIKEGKYSELLFTFSNAEITINGKTYEMEIERENIVVPCIFEINRDYTMNVYLEFFSENSIRAIKEGETYRFIFDPNIEVYLIRRGND